MSVFDLVLNLAWLIPLCPFLAFVAILLCTRRNHRLSHALAVAGVAIACALSQAVFWAVALHPVDGGARAFDPLRMYSIRLIPWFRIGSEIFSLGVYVDPATAVMLFTFPLVCLVILIYAIGHMHGDPGYGRFFAYSSLLATGMLGMVVFNNLLAFFIVWELMGVCAYLLIGFRCEKKPAVRAGLKAFLATRVGDLFFLFGLALLYSEVGSLAYRDVFNPQTVDYLAQTPFLGTSWSMASAIALLFFAGIAGMSAQFPLHTWLADAVQAPTPALALIQAATVVPAGIFLLVRAFPLFEVAQEAELAIGGLYITVVALIGTLTAILSSIAAVAQTDIRRVVAFSTISQVGTTAAAFGIGAHVAGVFHLATYAFASALLVLGSGSVSHAMERGHRHALERGEFDPNDMRGMGGLRAALPRTFWTFLAGGLALSGFPVFTACFWSRYGILRQAYESSPDVTIRAVFWMLAVAAGLIAFSAMRSICMTFLGQPRSTAAAHASESVPSMTVPLIVLVVFAIALGWIGIPDNFLGLDLPRALGLDTVNWFQKFVESAREAGPMTSERPTAFAWQPLAWGTFFTLGGLLLGWLVYGWKPMHAGETDRVEARVRRVRLGRMKGTYSSPTSGWLYGAARNGFSCDRIYRSTFVRGSIRLADLLHTLDRGATDGLVNLARRAARAISQTGAWFDTRVVGTSVDLARRAGEGLSRISSAFDLRVIDRLVTLIARGTRTLSGLSAAVETQVAERATDAVGEAVKASGQFIGPLQAGRVQNYLLLVCLMLLALVVTFFLILFLRI